MVAYRSPLDCPAIRRLETRLVLDTGAVVTSPIRVPRDAAQLIRELIGYSDRECFVALYLNGRNVVTHVHTVSIGTTTGAAVHPREVFKGAILANASALIVAHNHPSGNVQPSDQDEFVAGRVREAGELLGIELLDAFIVGPSDSYFSSSGGPARFPSTGAAKEVADGLE